MLKNNELLVTAFLVVLFLWWVMRPENKEGFDSKTVEFVPVCAKRYGLRGDPLRTSSIDKNYIRPDRHVRIHHGGDMMYVSNNKPSAEGKPFCKKVKCPIYTGSFTDPYDESDTCWKCDTACRGPTEIPDIHSHVPI